MVNIGKTISTYFQQILKNIKKRLKNTLYIPSPFSLKGLPPKRIIVGDPSAISESSVAILPIKSITSKLRIYPELRVSQVLKPRVLTLKGTHSSIVKFFFVTFSFSTVNS